MYSVVYFRDGVVVEEEVSVRYKCGENCTNKEIEIMCRNVDKLQMNNISNVNIVKQLVSVK